MTDLERRALLGDKQAQEECTRRGIVLTCPLCKGVGTLHSVNNFGSIYAVCQSCGLMTRGYKNARSAIKRWNTRPVPPIGRCWECKAYVDNKCMNTGYYKPETGFCDDFAPKDGESI